MDGPVGGEFYTAGERFWRVMNDENIKDAGMIGEGKIFACCETLTCFVNFLLCYKKYQGFDDSFRDISNIRHLEFKKQWVHTLRCMVKYVESKFLDDEENVKAFLGYERIENCPDILTKVVAVEDIVRNEWKPVGSGQGKQARSRGMFGEYVTEELADPYVLETMRGILEEL